MNGKGPDCSSAPRESTGTKRIRERLALKTLLLISVLITLVGLSTRIQADTGNCAGQVVTLPFTDVMTSPFFCQIAAAYFSGLTNGTTATTYSPNNNVTREQMAAFVTRTLDQSLKRGSPRAALGEWWTSKQPSRAYQLTGPNPRFLACDGLTVWASNTEGNSISRVDIKTCSPICTLTDVPSPEQMVIVNGYVYIASFQSPGKIYGASIHDVNDGGIFYLNLTVGPNPVGITYDGENLWTANAGTGPGTGSISKAPLITGPPDLTFTTGFSQPIGILFDGVNLWVTDAGDASLKRVDTTNGAILQTNALSGSVNHPVFDGTNLWIPCGSPDKVFVVRGGAAGPPLLGTVLAQLTGNGLSGPFQAAFDGERICVTNASAQTISLWKATDLSPIASVNVGNIPGYNSRGVCSDGTRFFVGLRRQAGGSGDLVFY